MEMLKKRRGQERSVSLLSAVCGYSPRNNIDYRPF